MASAIFNLEDLRARRPETLHAPVAEHLSTLPAGLERLERRSSVRTYLFGILYHKAVNLRDPALGAGSSSANRGEPLKRRILDRLRSS